IDGHWGPSDARRWMAAGGFLLGDPALGEVYSQGVPARDDLLTAAAVVLMAGSPLPRTPLGVSLLTADLHPTHRESGERPLGAFPRPSTQGGRHWLVPPSRSPDRIGPASAWAYRCRRRQVDLEKTASMCHADQPLAHPE